MSTISLPPSRLPRSSRLLRWLPSVSNPFLNGATARRSPPNAVDESGAFATRGIFVPHDAPALDADLKPRRAQPSAEAVARHDAAYSQLIRGQIEELLSVTLGAESGGVQNQDSWALPLVESHARDAIRNGGGLLLTPKRARCGSSRPIRLNSSFRWRIARGTIITPAIAKTGE